MSIDVDVANYTGVDTASAADSQALVDQHNSYLDGQGDYPVMRELLEPPQEVARQEPSPQEQNFRALREEVDRIKTEREAERKESQLQIDLLRANLTRPEPQQRLPERKMFDGKADDYIPDVAEWRSEMESREQGYQARLQELEFQTAHPDYVEVLGKHLGPLVTEKPHLRQVIERAPNPSQFAYELAKMAQQLREQTAPSQAAVSQPIRDAQRMVENSRRPGTLSQAGGQAALSKADYYASMSDAEFMKMANRHLDSI